MQTARYSYEMIEKHRGCIYNGSNLGFVGRPMHLLDDVSTECKTGDSTCVDLGKRACNSAIDCWGFAVHSGWGVQVYNSKTSNADLCDGTYGLMQNSNWNTYKKESGNILGT